MVYGYGYGGYRSNPKKDPPPQAPPERYGGSGDSGSLGRHNPYNNSNPLNSPTVDGGIKITTEQLTSWAELFDDAAMYLNLSGDYMMKIHVQPGYFQEANTIRDLITRFNGTFVPNSRLLADSSLYVSQALRLVATEFEKVEQANLDQNTGLTDLVSAMTKLETGLKSTPPIRPDVPER